VRFATLVWFVVASAAGVIAADQSAPVFTDQQVEAGRAAYAKNCASCHMPDLSGNAEIPPLVGETFLGTWKSKTTKDLRDYMSAAMPYGGPSLDAESYTVITAYILSTNGAVAGAEKLNASTRVPITDVIVRRVPH
jgi:mono/diheme cytochrome c family protein